ncbi:MAG: VWA domain-containing protein [Saprospiraceae bacterium]|nr:VWA domain-containing protein [Candidatus Brachybacter algidus]
MVDAHLSLPFPWWYTALCLLVGLAFATLLYNKTAFDHPWAKYAKYLLFTLRALAVAIICFLLCSPILKHISYTEQKPSIVIGLDQSQSVGFALKNRQAQITKKIAEIKDALSGDYNVSVLSIGNDLKNEVTDKFDKKATNINQFFENINESSSYSTLGAVVLLSDGIFNTGPSPLFEASRIKAPIYSVAIGDTTPAKDLTIRNTIHNEIGFMGDISKVQIDIQAFNLQGKSATVSVNQVNGTSNQQLQSKTINIANSNFFQTLEFAIPLNKAGLQKYVINVSQLPGEATFDNNSKEFFIDILDSKLNIDIVASAPHPDISALKYVIDENKNYDLKISYLNQTVKIHEKCDLLILYQVPTINQFSSAFENLWKTIENRKISTLFILGGQSNLSRFNQLQNVMQVSPGQANMNDVYGIVQSNFPIFSVKDEWKTALPTFPPLQIPFGNFISGPGANVLMYQKIGRVETKYPLWSIGMMDGQKVGVIAGEGLWRWKMSESARTGRTPVFNDIVSNTMRYLATREDKRKFKVRSDETNYEESDNIVFSGELYNENYELVNEPEVNMTLTGSDRKEFKYALDRTEHGYKLDIGQLNSGSYNYTARVKYQGKELTSTGNFNVRVIGKEMFDLVADFGLMRQLSAQSGGLTLYENQLDQLVEKIKYNEAIKPVISTNKKTDPLINLKWIFGLLALLLAAEWFIRRYMGKY